MKKFISSVIAATVTLGAALLSVPAASASSDYGYDDYGYDKGYDHGRHGRLPKLTDKERVSLEKDLDIRSKKDLDIDTKYDKFNKDKVKVRELDLRKRDIDVSSVNHVRFEQNVDFDTKNSFSDEVDLDISRLFKTRGGHNFDHLNVGDLDLFDVVDSWIF